MRPLGQLARERGAFHFSRFLHYHEAMSTITFNAQREFLSEAMDTSLATRADIERIERKLIEHDAKFDKLQWMIGIVIGLSVANFAKQYF